MLLLILTRGGEYQSRFWVEVIQLPKRTQWWKLGWEERWRRHQCPFVLWGGLVLSCRWYSWEEVYPFGKNCRLNVFIHRWRQRAFCLIQSQLTVDASHFHKHPLQKRLDQDFVEQLAITVQLNWHKINCYGTSYMAQEVKAPATKFSHLDSILAPQGGKREPIHSGCPLTFMHVLWNMFVVMHSYTHGHTCVHSQIN